MIGLTRYVTEFWVIERGNFEAAIAYPPAQAENDLKWLF
jgi:hypothetical protein